MSKFFNRNIVTLIFAALVAFTAGYAVADEAPPVPTRVQQSPQVSAQNASGSNPCGPATQAAYEEGMRHGGRDMHGKMMDDHQMGASGSRGMPMGSPGMPMGSNGKPMGPGGMQSECGGKPGCSKGMPKGTTGDSGSMAPNSGNSPMPMGHM